MSDEPTPDPTPKETAATASIPPFLGDPVRSYRGPAPMGDGPTNVLLGSTRMIARENSPVPPSNSTGGETGPQGVASNFRLIAPIGQGGMGEVWSAVQLSLQRVVAVKRLRRRNDSEDDSQYRRTMFQQEALTAAQLDHPNIVPIHELGVQQDGEPLIAMKYVRGRSWDEMIEEEIGNRAQEDYLSRHIRILVSVAQAVAFAHSRGIIHRDLKPHQVVVGEFGEVILMDWGLAVCVDTERLVRIPSGELLHLLPSPESAPSPAGTPAYMAPEQLDVVAYRATEKTDVYLMGGMLYHVLTGKAPRAGMRDELLRGAIRSGQYTALMEARPNVSFPEELVRLMEHSMRPEQETRCPSAIDFVRRLEDYLSGSGKRLEAMALTRNADALLHRDGNAGYDECAEVIGMLGRAAALWPAYPEAKVLREEALEVFAGKAIANGDLILARVQIERMQPAPQREALMARIAAADIAALRRERTRRTALAASVILLAVLTVGSLWFNRMLSYRTVQAEEASSEANRQRENAVRAGNRLEHKLYESSIALAARLLEADAPNLARTELDAAPAAHRDIEWGVLRAIATPELRAIDAGLGPILRIVASGPAEAIVAVSDVGACAVLPLEGPIRPIRSEGVLAAAYSTDGQRLSLLMKDARLLTFDKEDHLLSSTTTEPGASDFTVVADTFVLVAGNGEVRRIAIDTGEVLWRLPSKGGAALPRLAADERRNLLAVARGKHEIEIIDLAEGSPIGSLQGHAGAIADLTFAPSGELISSSADTTARVWDVIGGRERLRLLASTELDVRAIINSSVACPDTGLILTAGNDGQAKLWDVDNGSLTGRLSGHGGAVTDSAVIADLGLFVTSSNDGIVRVWNSRRRGAVTMPGHEGRVVARGFPNADSVVTMAHDNTARFWNLRSGENYLLIRPPLEKYGYCEGRVSADGSRVALMTRDNVLRVYQLPDARVIAAAQFPIEGDPDDAGISPDGAYAAMSGPHGTVLMLKIESNDSWVIPDSPDSPVMAIEFSSDSNSIAVGYHDGRVMRYACEGGSLLATYAGHQRWVEKIDFSSDGSLIATASFDTTARIWDSASGAMLHECTGHGSWLTDVDFTNADTRIVTSSADGTIRFWNVENGAEILQLKPAGGIVDSVQISPGSDYLVATFRGTSPEAWSVAPWKPESAFSLVDWEKARLASALAMAHVGSTHRGRIAFLRQHVDVISPDIFAGLVQELSPIDRDRLLPMVDQLDKPTAPATRRELVAILENLPQTVDDSNATVALKNTLSELESAFAPFISLPLRPYRGTAHDEEVGQPLRVLVVGENAPDERSLFINGNRPELGNWSPNNAAMSYLGRNPAGDHVWEFALTLRPMDFKFTYSKRGEPWGDKDEWMGPPNRHIDTRSVLYIDRSGTILYLARYGELFWGEPQLEHSTEGYKSDE